MLAVRSGLAASLAALVLLLAALGPGIGLPGWVAGLTCGAVLAAAVARSASTRGVPALGPADLVTFTRAVLGCGVAALVAQSFLWEPAVGTLVVLATTALLLDAVDGPVARRTGTTSDFGARIDGEADAFLMLVLSVYAARSAGAWVLAIGALRYLFAVAGWLLPWLRARLPDRYWRKVVTATSGTALVLAASDLAPREATYTVLAVALVLLVESFGRDVCWLWRHRAAATTTTSSGVGARGLPVP